MSDSKELQPTKHYLDAPKEFDKVLREEDMLIRPGMFLVYTGQHPETYEIVDIYYKPVEVWWKDGEKLKEPEYEDELFVSYKNEGKIKEKQFKEFRQSYYAVSSKNGEELLEEALEEFESEEFTTPYDFSPQKGDPTTTDLVTQDKGKLIAYQDQMILRRDYLNAKKSILEAHVNKKLRKLYDMKEEMMAKITKMKKIIHTIELYLGINEGIDHIHEGEFAAEDIPITLRQKILYIDEEVGDPTDGGYDFNNVGDFYEWLGKTSGYWKKKNYEVIIPEEKCVVVFQIRRKDKDYGTDNPFLEGMINQNNKQTCFVIRNGENLWAVWADIKVDPRLFPGRDEIQQTINKIEQEESYWSKENMKEKVENTAFRYQLQILVLQGLIERTDIFGNSVKDLNLMKIDLEKETRVKFIYDDTDPVLDDHFGNFKKWRDELNETIKTGSRILFIPSMFRKSWGKWESDGASHYLKRWQHWHSYPASPGMGIYTLYWDKEFEQHYFKYLPGDEVFDPEGDGFWGSYRDRKNRVSFFLNTLDAPYIINYDALDPEDFDRIEYALHSRVNRHEYMGYIPALMAMRSMRRAELKEEDNFLELIFPYFMKEVPKYEVFEEEYGKPAIEWWKFKNKYKRSLVSDDSKAVRMIKKKIERMLRSSDKD